MVEAAFADHPWHVAILVEKPAGPVDVGAEEGSGYQGNGHNFGGGESNLGIVVEAAHGLQEVVTQAVDGGYGIVQDVLPIQERLCGLRIGRILSASIGGNLGCLLSFLCGTAVACGTAIARRPRLLLAILNGA